MNTPSPLALCPRCGTLIPLVTQLGARVPLYCSVPSHYADAGYDATTVAEQFQRYKQELGQPAEEAWREVEDGLQQLREDRRRIAELTQLMADDQRRFENARQQFEEMVAQATPPR